MRRNDPERIRAAKLAGRVQRLRDLTLTESTRWDALRAEWPALGERVGAVAELVDWDHTLDDDG